MLALAVEEREAIGRQGGRAGDEQVAALLDGLTRHVERGRRLSQDYRAAIAPLEIAGVAYLEAGAFQDLAAGADGCPAADERDLDHTMLPSLVRPIERCADAGSPGAAAEK